MIYENGKRFYIVEGNKYPSVNTVLTILPESTQLQAWKNRTQNWQEIMEYRKLQGSMIHYRIASTIAIKAQLPPPSLPLRMEEKRLLQDIFADSKKRQSFNKEVEFAIAMFNDWELEYHPEWLNVEMVVYSKEIKYAGTTDLYCIIKPYYWLIDIKSNPHLFDKYEYQLSAYRVAIQEMGLKCDKMGLLNIVPTLRGSFGYRFTEIGNFSKEFVQARLKFNRQYTA